MDARGIYATNNYLYLADGAGGFRMYSLSEPVNPSLVGSIATGQAAEGVFATGKYAYWGEGTAGMKILRIAR
ncbi:MAG: hypothetical protein KDK39_19040 [Leptospiraceae bacterium]|nr:hypothetical protein [Leptospiraceae bacterium]